MPTLVDDAVMADLIEAMNKPPVCGVPPFHSVDEGCQFDPGHEGRHSWDDGNGVLGWLIRHREAERNPAP